MMLDLRPQEQQSGPRTRDWRRAAAALGPYLVAGAIYIALGVWEPRFMLSWAEGIVFLLVVVWALPALYHRSRRK